VKLIHIAKLDLMGLSIRSGLKALKLSALRVRPRCVHILLIPMNLVAGSKVGTKHAKLIRPEDSDQSSNAYF
jgi:hypothetical protein